MSKSIKCELASLLLSALCLFGLVTLCMTVDKIDRVLKVNPKVYSNSIFKNMFEAISGFFNLVV
jgi:hypothetical protein